MERARDGRWWCLYNVGSDHDMDLLYSGRSVMKFVWPDLALLEEDVFDMAAERWTVLETMELSPTRRVSHIDTAVVRDD
jgi:hypothetical protein